MFRESRTLLMSLLVFVVGTFAYGQGYPTARITVLVAETASGGVWDSNFVTVNFNGFTDTVNYGEFSTPAALAAGLAAMFSRDYVAMDLYAKAGADHIAIPM